MKTSLGITTIILDKIDEEDNNDADNWGSSFTMFEYYV